jgi:glycine/D-amino acid oxidase-like deaminating enzyme
MGGIDVTLRGAGIFGLAVAWASARRGARVRVVERRRIGAGASGGLVGALAPHVPEQWNAKKQFQLESLLMADSWWAGVAAASGADPGYARTGRVQPLADAASVVLARARAAGAAALWQGRAAWEVTADAGGWAVPGEAFVRDTLSARLHPRRALAALAGAIRSAGGEIVEGGEAQDAGAVVHATGWEGLLVLSAPPARPAGGGVKGQAALFALDARDRPQLYLGGLHVVAHADGTTAVGSTSEREFLSPEATDGGLDALIAEARARVPELAGAEVTERWAGIRPRARTRAPMLGVWPGRPGHFVANGGFKIGFGLAPKVGETLADLVLEGRDGIPAGFRVEDSL